VNALNASVNTLKSNDSLFANELQAKTEQFISQLEELKAQNDSLTESKKQFEFVLEEKSRESAQLKTQVESGVQMISGQSKAIEKLHNDLRSLEKDLEEFTALKQQYEQIYVYLEEKNKESLSYYDEIQRLNSVISDLNVELLSLKQLNEKYEMLMSDFQTNQGIVDDLDELRFELNNTIANIKVEADTEVKQEIGEDIEKEKNQQLNLLEQECSQYYSENQRLNQQMQSLKCQELRVAELSQEILDLKSQMSQDQTEMQRLSQEIQSLKQSDESHRLSSIITELNQEIINLRGNHDNQASLEQSEMQRLNQEIQKFETEESQRLNTIITDLNQQISQYQT
jgi:chromosome segregation ATPase